MPDKSRRVLVVKLTSMGDVLHLMPALTDLQQQHSDIVVDWMVEDSFAQLPEWHPIVDKVIPVATRRWRKWSLANLKEFGRFWRHLRSVRYDAVIDAQGLMKSAVFARFAKLTKTGKRIGFSGESIKESPAARLYGVRVKVERQQHAVDRLRQLFAGGFGYSLPPDDPNYRIGGCQTNSVSPPTVFLFHGTTWPTKHVPERLWRTLAEMILEDGFQVALCWGDEIEKARAQRIVDGLNGARVLPKSSLIELKDQLSSASGAIAVDTGLGHMAAALGLPCVSIYGSTKAKLTGAVGRNQQWLQSDYPCSPCLLKECPKLTEQVTEPPCYSGLDAAQIWQRLYDAIA